jgi:hypothetical protein
MEKVALGPLESIVARKLAYRRGITVEQLVENLVQREATVELVFGDSALTCSPPKPTLESIDDRA